MADSWSSESEAGGREEIFLGEKSPGRRGPEGHKEKEEVDFKSHVTARPCTGKTSGCVVCSLLGGPR